MAKATEVTRHILNAVERELWGRSAGRCQFSDCNKLLYKSPVTQQPVNLAEMAHIYSFSREGPRGWGPFKKRPSGLNDVTNLMLVCHDCHKLIDHDKEGVKYSAELLKSWKEAHETRVRIATGIPANKRSHVVMYGSRIGAENSPLSFAATYDAMFPDWYPVEDRPISLSMRSALDDSEQGFWDTEAAHLTREFERHIRPRIEEGQPNHFSIFALASQPLLTLLGSLFTDKVPAIVYQPVREPKTWRRQPHPETFQYLINPPADTDGAPVVVFSLSDRVKADRITAVLGDKVSIWEFTCTTCHNDFLRSDAQLSEFRQLVRKLIVDIRAAHPQATGISMFQAMPAACAVELGRVRMPKADLPWMLYDHNPKHGRFIETITIGAANG